MCIFRRLVRFELGRVILAHPAASGQCNSYGFLVLIECESLRVKTNSETLLRLMFSKENLFLRTLGFSSCQLGFGFYDFSICFLIGWKAVSSGGKWFCMGPLDSLKEGEEYFQVPMQDPRHSDYLSVTVENDLFEFATA